MVDIYSQSISLTTSSRTKLSQDPNNTAWARNTDTFGHKILSKQGWKQGDYLGAENASHSAHYTAANASHIRVMLREDNLGLGAKIGGGSADTFGLSMFSGLLGRLNGKDEATLKKQEDSIRDAELRMYGDRKFGFMNFVSGGLLVGDKMEEPKSTKIEDIKPQVVAVKVGQETKSKKRKAEDEETKSRNRKAGNDEEKSKKRKSDKSAKKDKHRKSHDTAAEVEESSASETPIEKPANSSTSDSSEEEEEEENDSKAHKRKRKSSKESKSKPTDDDEKSRLKHEKRARKESRRKRKEEKCRRRAEKEEEEEASSAKASSAVVSQAEAEAEAESNSNTSTPQPFMGGRQALRQRYIMQKRMASSNAAALKEIFMLLPTPAS